MKSLGPASIGGQSARVLDLEFARWVRRSFCRDCDEEQGNKVEGLAMAVSHALNLKHSCLDLVHYPALQDPTLNELLEDLDPELVRGLMGSALCKEGASTHPVPLVCSPDGKLVWLQKYHGFEHRVAVMIRTMTRGRAELSNEQRETLDALYRGQDFIDQRNAVETALTCRFSIITGGPGTGKTWTVARIVAVMMKHGLEDGRKPRIALAAPTGKAAARMAEALGQAVESEPVRQLFHDVELPKKARTLHSLLGISMRSPQPRRNEDNPLAIDLLIVDEASMVDLPMMYRLLCALPEQARLILLGDKDQLASVEAGSVLGELCNPESEHYGAIRSSIAVISRSYRYRDSPEIGTLATAINAAGPLPDFEHNRHVTWNELKTGDDVWAPGWMSEARRQFTGLSALIGKESNVTEILLHQQSFQILCALRNGPFGVNGINVMVAGALGKQPGDWYAGLPVMVTVNDHDRNLFNGDVGLVLPVLRDEDGWHVDERTGSLKACFFTGDGAVKAVSRAQMPGFETCYAVTVHKSQGSEYEKVVLVLPDSAEEAENNPVITRELVYTGVTRARKMVEIWSGRGVLEAAVRKQTIRMSGLGYQLALLE